MQLVARLQAKIRRRHALMHLALESHAKQYNVQNHNVTIHFRTHISWREVRFDQGIALVTSEKLFSLGDQLQQGRPSSATGQTT